MADVGDDDDDSVAGDVLDQDLPAPVRARRVRSAGHVGIWRSVVIIASNAVLWCRQFEPGDPRHMVVGAARVRWEFSSASSPARCELHNELRRSARALDNQLLSGRQRTVQPPASARRAGRDWLVAGRCQPWCWEPPLLSRIFCQEVLHALVVTRQELSILTPTLHNNKGGPFLQTSS